MRECTPAGRGPAQQSHVEDVLVYSSPSSLALRELSGQSEQSSPSQQAPRAIHTCFAHRPASAKSSRSLPRPPRLTPSGWSSPAARSGRPSGPLRPESTHTAASRATRCHRPPPRPPPRPSRCCAPATRHTALPTPARRGASARGARAHPGRRSGAAALRRRSWARTGTALGRSTASSSARHRCGRCSTRGRASSAAEVRQRQARTQRRAVACSSGTRLAGLAWER